MRPEDAIIGVFLATYSSKGDHLPLRYPLTQFDYEYAQVLMKEKSASENKKLLAQGRAETGSGLRNEGENSHSASNVDLKSAHDGNVTRISSQISIAPSGVSSQYALSPQPQEPARILNSGTAEKKNVNAEIEPTVESQTGCGDGYCIAGSERLFTDKALSSCMEKKANKEPCMQQPMHGFETRFLAQLFSPKPSMSDKRFQVAIDDVLFVGHPLRDDPREKAQDPNRYDTERDEAYMMSQIASNLNMDEWKLKPDLILDRSSRHRGRKLLADLGLLNLVLHREPSEAADSAISEGERAVRDSNEWKRRGYYKPQYDSMFHIVFMLDNTAPGVEILANLLYEHVLQRLTKALMIEQNEANYVLTESRVIRNLNDIAFNEKYTSAKYLREIIRQSTLACDLITLYNGLRDGEVIRLHIHKRILISLQIPRGPRIFRPLPPMKHRQIFNTGIGFSGYNSNNLIERSNIVSVSHTPRPTTPAENNDANNNSQLLFQQPGSNANVQSSTALIKQGAERINIDHATSQTISPMAQTYQGPAMFEVKPNCISQGDFSSLISLQGSSCRWSKQPSFPRNSNTNNNIGTINDNSSIAVSDRELQPGEYSCYPKIEPYHALLLLEDATKLKRRLLFSDASPTLVSLIECASPTRPLSRLHTLVDCSFAQLCRLVSHLVYWNVARVTCPVSLRYIYVPTIDKLTKELCSRFNEQGFSICTLPKLLARLNSPRPTGRILEELINAKDSESKIDREKLDEKRAEMREILIFLLREGAIAQLHTWPVLLVPNHVKYNLGQDQFVNLAFRWFQNLYTQHPDLLGAFPRALLNRGELEDWKSDEMHERECNERLVYELRITENEEVLCRVLRKVALKRVRDKWEEAKQGKHGRELRRMDKQMLEEEDKVREFCNKLESKKLAAGLLVKQKYNSELSKIQQQRIESRRAKGKVISEDYLEKNKNRQQQQTQFEWYDFVKETPDFEEFTKEVVEKYVTYVPTSGYTHGTDAEKRYISKLIEKNPEPLQSYFRAYSRYFNGKHHLVELNEYDKTIVSRLESIMQESPGLLLLPRHI